MAVIVQRPQPLRETAGPPAGRGVRRLDAEERVRLQVSAEVHDGPLQLLLEAAQELADDPTAAGARARVLVSDAAGQLRRMLTPPTAPVSGPAAQAELARWCQSLQAYRSFGYRVVVSDRHLIGQLELGVARELITNAVRHSGGDEVSVRLDRHDDRLGTVSVRDDGSGFPATWRAGFGHTALQARTQAAGGIIEFHEPADGGAFISVQLPVPALDRPERQGRD